MTIVQQLDGLFWIVIGMTFTCGGVAGYVSRALEEKKHAPSVPSVPPADEDKWAMLARTGHLSPEVADASREVAAHVNASRVTR